jgi:hypothetical protein
MGERGVGDPMNEASTPVTPAANPNRDVLKGVGLTALGHVIPALPLGLFSVLTRGNGGAALGIFYFGIGITQLIYVVPAVIYFRRNGKPLIAKGVIIGASITFLLNAACFGVLFAVLSNTSFH